MNVYLTIHRTKSRKLDGRHPVVIRIINNGKTKERTVKGYYYHLAEWNDKQNLPKGASAKLKNHFSNEVKKYLDVITDFDGADVSIDAVIEKASGTKKGAPTVLCYYDDIVTRFKKANQIKTSGSYHGCRNNLETFLASADISDQIKFGEIDVAFLNKYKTWLDGQVNQYGQPLKDNTKHIYLRTLRSLYNKAIADNYAKESNYPFRKFFAQTNFDLEGDDDKGKAISIDDVLKIEKLRFDADSMLLQAQQLFLFGFYGNGINFADIARMKWNQYDRDNLVLTYQRVKLKRKKGKNKKVHKIPVEGYIADIISHFQPKSGIVNENYIFPILDKNMHKTEQQIHDRLQKVITRVNRDLKKIGVAAGIERPLSTYSWRHSAFSAQVNELGVTMRQAMTGTGHSKQEVLEGYIAKTDTSDHDIYRKLQSRRDEV